MIKGPADVQTPTFHPEVRMAEMVSMGVGNKAFRDKKLSTTAPSTIS